MSATTQCPECSSDVPIPQLRRGRGEVVLRCKVCRAMLAIERSPEIHAEFDSDDALGKAFNLPRYELLSVLGRGGMGMVFSAVRLQDNELVAIKVLPPECWRYPELLQRFHMEAEMMASLDHPNIVPILDRGRWNEYPYIVMDYVPGCTLKRRIEKAAPLGVDEVVAIAAPVAEAIQACHDRGFVHRDLKPGNVLLAQTGRVLVTDFGIANLIQRLGDHTDHGVMIGTPQYIAPEQLENGSNVSLRADQFSLAVIMYEMLMRSLPVGMFDAPTKRHKEMTRAAEKELLRALAHDERNRHDSMRHFVRAFRKALDRPPANMPPEEIIRRAATPYAPTDRDFPGVGPAIRVAVVDESGAVVREERRATTIVDLADEFGAFDLSPDFTPGNEAPPRELTPMPSREAELPYDDEPPPVLRREDTPAPAPESEFFAEPAGELPSPVAVEMAAAGSRARWLMAGALVLFVVAIVVLVVLLR